MNYYRKKKSKLKDFKKMAYSKGKTFLNKNNKKDKFVNISISELDNYFIYCFKIESKEYYITSSKNFDIAGIVKYSHLFNFIPLEFQQKLKNKINKKEKIKKWEELEKKCFNESNIFSKKQLVTRNRVNYNKTKNQLINFYNNDSSSIESSVFLTYSSLYKHNNEKFDYLW